MLLKSNPKYIIRTLKRKIIELETYKDDNVDNYYDRVNKIHILKNTLEEYKEACRSLKKIEELIIKE